MQLCNCIQNHSQPTETAVARIPAAENSRFFIDTTSIELALLIEEYTCKSCAEVQLYCSSYFLTVPSSKTQTVAGESPTPRKKRISNRFGIGP